MDRLCRLIVYFCTHLSCNSGNTRRRGYFAAKRQIHNDKRVSTTICPLLKLNPQPSFFIDHLSQFFLHWTEWKCFFDLFNFKVIKIFQICQRKFWSFPKPSKQASAMSMSELTLFFSKEINRKFGTIWIKCHILTAWNKSNTFIRLDKSLKLGKGLWNAFEYGIELHNHLNSVQFWNAPLINRCKLIFISQSRELCYQR